MFYNAALNWKCNRQDSTALSSVEAELIALSEGGTLTKYTQLLFKELSLHFNEIPIFCDNKGAIQNAKHPTTSNKLKHVDIKCFYIRECIDRKICKVFKIAGIENPADCGTKVLGYTKQSLFGNFMLNRMNASTAQTLQRSISGRKKRWRVCKNLWFFVFVLMDDKIIVTLTVTRWNTDHIL